MSIAKNIKKKEAFVSNSVECFTETFLGIAHQLLRIFYVFGMVLPVPKSRKDTYLGFYKLMVPGNGEKQLYSEIMWNEVSTLPQKEGWSNIPILMVVFSYLVKVNVIKFDRSFLEFFIKTSERPDVDCYEKGPRFMVGSACLTLLDLSSLVLYGETHPGVEVSFADKNNLFADIKKHFHEANKQWLYNNMANYFTKGFPEVIRKTAPADISQTKDKPPPTAKSIGKQKRKIGEPLSTKQAKITPKKPKTTPQPSTKSKVPKPTRLSERDDKAPSGAEESDDEPILSLVAKKPKKPSGVGDDKSTSSHESGLTVPYYSRKTDSGILEPDRQEPAQLDRTVEEIATATTEPVDVHVDVPQFHPSRPPKYINTKFTSWYWTLQDVKHTDTWTYPAKVSDIENRIRENIINIIVTEVAIEYAKIKQVTEGNELLNILAEPFKNVQRPYWPGDEERKKWHSMLIELDDYVTNLTTNGGMIPKPLVAPGEDVSSFCNYFADFVDDKISKKPAGRKEGEKPAFVEDTKVKPFWNRLKVFNMAEFLFDNVQAMIHKWKCCILYDTMCRSYFHGVVQRKEVSDGLFGNSEIKKLFPSTPLKEEWEGTFNMLVYHLQDLEIHSRNDNWMDPEDVEPRFLNALIKTTGRMLEMALTAGETQEDAVMGEAPSITAVQTATVPIGKPRPPLCEAVVKDLVVYDELCGLFFHHDGHLRQDLRSSVKWEAPHGFTSFGNFFTKDTRWFITFTQVPSNIKGEFDTIDYSFLLLFVYITDFFKTLLRIQPLSVQQGLQPVIQAWATQS